jgi:hypothetical protein
MKLLQVMFPSERRYSSVLHSSYYLGKEFSQLIECAATSGRNAPKRGWSPTLEHCARHYRYTRTQRLVIALPLFPSLFRHLLYLRHECCAARQVARNAIDFLAHRKGLQPPSDMKATCCRFLLVALETRVLQEMDGPRQLFPC